MASPLINFGRLASGIDTKAVIAALVGVRRKPIELLLGRKAEFNALKARYEALKGKVTALRDRARDLEKASQLLSFGAASSDEKVLKVSASGSATEGSFAVTVNALAKAEIEASNGFADFDQTAVGSGTIQLTVAGESAQVAIDPAASTLEDVRDAINDADLGVTATIVNEGTGATPYKLVLKADDTGAENTVELDLSGFTGSLAFSEVQAASNASVTVNGITVERPTNVVDDVVPGVSFTALSVGESNVTLSVDLGAVKEKIDAYVAAHNDLLGYVNSEIAVSGTTKKGGAFNGESAVRSLKNQILAQFGASGYPGGALSTLAQVGVTLQNDGKIEFDAAKFDAAAGESLEDVVALLTTKGDFTTGDDLTLVSAPAQVPAGEYAIAITQAATKAAAAGAATSLAAGLAQDERLTVTVGEESVEIDLAAGDTLEQAVTKINSALKDAGLDLVASDDGGQLTFTAKAYGSAGSFTVASDQGNGAGTLGIGAGIAGTGLDVAGTINGEAAVGTGQFLEAADGTALDGTKVRYGGDAATTGKVTIGPDGFFVKMSDVLSDALDPISGSIALRIDGLGDTVADIDDRVASMEDRVEQYEAQLQQRFAALESILGGLQSQQAHLASLFF